ncbi:MAG: helix-turn-helix domain-containing protein [Chloroflexi bacterium]|nr:helix-turn-helix domain-containing protein [Chloroflexota bacterium]
MSSVELRARRQALQLSQAGLAGVLGVSANTVARWERGEMRMRNAFNVHLALTRVESEAAAHAFRQDVVRHNLPAHLPALIGREDELRELSRRLLDMESGLLTLIGAGGCGKTRLALQVAVDSKEAFPNGVWLVDFSSLSDANLVASGVAGVLGIHERSGERIVDTLIAALQPRRLLLLLDNCEHLVAAVAELSAGLLRGCPGVRILATSRERLRVDNEIAWSVPPLAYPDPNKRCDFEAVAQSPAVRLFVARAQAMQKDFALTKSNGGQVADICARLDGLPLAIELAAVRMRALGVNDLRDRLDQAFQLLVSHSRGLPDRQRTLQATLDWSHQLLTPAEQVLLRRLAVFGGGWTLDAAESVCGVPPIERAEVLDLLTALIDKSLVLPPGANAVARYRLLETIRQYSRRQLELAGEAPLVQRRHSAFYAHLVDAAAPHMQTAQQEDWIAQLVLELDNLRATLQWCEAEAGNTSDDTGLRVVDGLRDLWLNRGQHSEGRNWIERMLASSRGPASKLVARVLHWAAQFAMFQGDISQAERRVTQALRLSRKIGYTEFVAHALVTAGFLARTRGDLDAAISSLEEGLTQSRGLGDVDAKWRALQGLAQAYQERADVDRARSLTEEALAVARRRGDVWAIAHSLHLLGNLAETRGDLGMAAQFLESSLAEWRRIDADYGLHWLLVSLGRVALRRGDVQQARTCIRESLRLASTIGDRTALARCLDQVAGVAEVMGEPSLAMKLLAASDALRDVIRAPRQPPELPAYRQILDALHSRLGPQASMDASRAGRMMRSDDLIIAAEAVLTAPYTPAAARSGAPAALLTPRQVDVLRLVARGMTNREIAAELVLSEKTVGHHLENIFERLGVNSRASATLVAACQGLATLDER